MRVDRWVVRGAVAAGLAMACTIVPLQTAGAAGPAPVARDDLFEVGTGPFYALGFPHGIFANDTPGTPGGTLTAQLVDGPSHGTLQLADWGSIGYEPEFGFVGDDVFTYRAVDTNGSVSAPARVTLRVGYPGGTDPRQPSSVRLEGPKGLSLNPLGFTVSGNVYDAAGRQIVGEIAFRSGGTTGKVLCRAVALGGFFQVLPHASCVVPLADALPLLLGGTITATFNGDLTRRPSSTSGPFGIL